MLNRWTGPGTSNKYPRFVVGDGTNWQSSDLYITDGSYLRLKNVTVSYDLTNLLRKCSHFGSRNSRLSVYVSGENLCTITDYTGIDPECGGWDAMKYPVARTFSFGVKLTY